MGSFFDFIWGIFGWTTFTADLVDSSNNIVHSLKFRVRGLVDSETFRAVFTDIRTRTYKTRGIAVQKVILTPQSCIFLSGK